MALEHTKENTAATTASEDVETGWAVSKTSEGRLVAEAP